MPREQPKKTKKPMSHAQAVRSVDVHSQYVINAVPLKGIGVEPYFVRDEMRGFYECYSGPILRTPTLSQVNAMLSEFGLEPIEYRPFEPRTVTITHDGVTFTKELTITDEEERQRFRRAIKTHPHRVRFVKAGKTWLDKASQVRDDEPLSRDKEVACGCITGFKHLDGRFSTSFVRVYASQRHVAYRERFSFDWPTVEEYLGMFFLSGDFEIGARLGFDACSYN